MMKISFTCAAAALMAGTAAANPESAQGRTLLNTECTNILEGLNQGETTTSLYCAAAAVYPEEALLPLADPDTEFTIFAPPDEQVLLLSGGLANGDLDEAQVRSVLGLHIVPQYLPADMLANMDGETVETLSGEQLTVSVQGETIMLMYEDNSVEVTMPDTPDACGESQVIHMINNAILPPPFTLQDVLDLDAVTTDEVCTLAQQRNDGLGASAAPDAAPGAAPGMVPGMAPGSFVPAGAPGARELAEGPAAAPDSAFASGAGVAAAVVAIAAIALGA